VANLYATGRIVVGAALTGFDDAVLAIALAEAHRRATALHVVHALQITDDDLRRVEASEVMDRQARQTSQREAARAALLQAIGHLATGFGSSVPVTYQVDRADPATFLLGAARDAQLLVAGTRSGNGSAVTLGTVSQDVAVHAPCPVLLVPVAAVRPS